MSERLEEIKEAIAHQLGLTNDWMDGTYLYYLTRSKSAFSVGTMTLDDFTEIDEELLEEIFNAIKPYFIEQAERVEELEEERDEWKDTAQSYYMTNQELREQNKRYKQALEFYADEEHYKEKLISEAQYDADGICISNDEYAPPIIYFDSGEKARQALEGEK